MTKTRSGTTFEQGDVVLLSFPFSDLSATKQRPAMVLTNATYNGASSDVLVCAITSNLANASHSVLIESKDMATGALVATSRVKADKVFTAEQAIIKKRVGRLKPAIVASVKKELASIL